jgi:hypothetical protein
VATRVVTRVRGEHDQGLRNLERRIYCLESDIFPAAATSLEVTVITAGSAERVFSSSSCRGALGFQFSRFDPRFLAGENLFSTPFRGSIWCEEVCGTGRCEVGASRLVEGVSVKYSLERPAAAASAATLPPASGGVPSPSSSADDPDDRLRI